MEITSEAANLQENAETRLENLSYVVRHLEDALAMRHRRRRYQQRHQSPRPTSTVNTNKESTTSQSRHRQQEYYQVRQFSPNLEKSRNRELTLDATREAEGQAISTRHDKTTYISKPSVSAKAVLALEIRPTEVDTKLGRVQVAKEIGHTTREIEESKAIGAYPTAGSTVVETTQGWPSVVPIQTSHRSRVPGPRPCSPRSSSYLAGLYLVSKALYVLNSIGQLLLMAR
ncbi:unnamed protein product [Protopolystoma xenopodis]|uniref:Uncharacterized protein n=1 Tax=Protopolystoma xenopodis TaxID=117903 RepID=A0A3S5BT03_9PLAT|nr:unnamed protein product [Protopolystoma xenopodis]